jgi:hypothetical protein
MDGNDQADLKRKELAWELLRVTASVLDAKHAENWYWIDVGFVDRDGKVEFSAFGASAALKKRIENTSNPSCLEGGSGFPLGCSTNCALWTWPTHDGRPQTGIPNECLKTQFEDASKNAASQSLATTCPRYFMKFGSAPIVADMAREDTSLARQPGVSTKSQILAQLESPKSNDGNEETREQFKKLRGVFVPNQASVCLIPLLKRISFDTVGYVGGIVICGHNPTIAQDGAGEALASMWRELTAIKALCSEIISLSDIVPIPVVK